MEIKNTQVKDIILIAKVLEIAGIGIYKVDDVTYTNKIYDIRLHSDILGTQATLTFLETNGELKTIKKVIKKNDSKESQEFESIINIIKIGKLEDSKYLYLVEEIAKNGDILETTRRNYYEGDFNMPNMTQEIKEDQLAIKRTRQKK